MTCPCIFFVDLSFDVSYLSFDVPGVSFDVPGVSFDVLIVSFDVPDVSFDVPDVSFDVPKVTFDLLRSKVTSGVSEDWSLGGVNALAMASRGQTWTQESCRGLI